jgi:hypothetical protein
MKKFRALSCENQKTIQAALEKKFELRFEHERQRLDHDAHRQVNFFFLATSSTFFKLVFIFRQESRFARQSSFVLHQLQLPGRDLKVLESER